MPDILTKEQRSYCMSRIRSRWTSQERKIHNHLKGNRIRHRMHPRIEGSPDILFKEKKTALFLHGCFWHKCPECFRAPRTRTAYWLKKIRGNARRDLRNERKLRRAGFSVMKIWEHEVKRDFPACIRRIKKRAVGPRR